MAVTDVVGDFIATLTKTPTNKAPDGFWPIGVFRSRFASVLVIERLLSHGPVQTMHFELDWAPSVLLNLYYALALGCRESTLGRDEVADFGRLILEGVAFGRASGLVNSDGTNRLVAMEHILEQVEFPRDGDANTARSTLELGALAIGYAEAVAFNKHRLITELHGPYCIANRHVIVRTVNLDLAAPLSAGFNASHKRLLVVSEMRFPSARIPRTFDIWGHPVYDAWSIRRERSWVIGVSDTDMRILSVTEVEAYCTAIRRDLERRLAQIDGMRAAELCAESGRITLWVALVALGAQQSDALQQLQTFPSRVRPGEIWKSNRVEFLRALDLRMEWN